MPLRDAATTSPIADALRDAEAVIPCPPSLRASAQRALVMRLERAAEELGCCAASAREIGLAVAARRIDGVRRICAEMTTVIEGDPR